MKQILRVLVGSRAHRLATAESDYDYRGVFITPTRDLLRVGGNPPNEVGSTDDNVENTSWEIGKFLKMALSCNPTVLECFLAPVEHRDRTGEQLRDLFPHVWEPRRTMQAYMGYGQSQRKKFQSHLEKRPEKSAVAWLRSLYNCWELLRTGTFSVDMTKSPLFDMLMSWKTGDFTESMVLKMGAIWEEEVRWAYEHTHFGPPSLVPVNEFLLKVRKEHW